MNDLWKGIAIFGMWGSVASIVIFGQFTNPSVPVVGLVAAFFGTWAVAWKYD